MASDELEGEVSRKQVYVESKFGRSTLLAFNLAYTVPSWPLYIGSQVSRIGQGPIQITISTYGKNSYLDYYYNWA
jgi:hypothetical protein